MYVVYVTVHDVCGLSLVVCCLSNFKIDRLGQSFCYLSVSHFFLSLILVYHHGVWSALKIWDLIAVLFLEEYMWEQKVDGLKKLGERVWVRCGENSNEPTCSVKDGELN
jgi:hypothetical protein